MIKVHHDDPVEGGLQFGDRTVPCGSPAVVVAQILVMVEEKRPQVPRPEALLGRLGRMLLARVEIGLVEAALAAGRGGEDRDRGSRGRGGQNFGDDIIDLALDVAVGGEIGRRSIGIAFAGFQNAVAVRIFLREETAEARSPLEHVGAHAGVAAKGVDGINGETLLLLEIGTQVDGMRPVGDIVQVAAVGGKVLLAGHLAELVPLGRPLGVGDHGTDRRVAAVGGPVVVVAEVVGVVAGAENDHEALGTRDLLVGVGEAVRVFVRAGV